MDDNPADEQYRLIAETFFSDQAFDVDESALVCPGCFSTDVTLIPETRTWQCNNCGVHFDGGDALTVGELADRLANEMEPPEQTGRRRGDWIDTLLVIVFVLFVLWLLMHFVVMPYITNTIQNIFDECMDCYGMPP